MVSQKYINCCQWDEENIKGFFADYRWLSNFHECKVIFKGLEFKSSEAAYMYAKLLKDDNLAQYEAMKDLPPNKVKKWGQKIELRPRWDEIKFDVMEEVLWDKFTGNEDLKQKLINTGEKYLEETCSWHDNFWGNCICDECSGKGQNNLGKILMKIRDKIK